MEGKYDVFFTFEAFAWFERLVEFMSIGSRAWSEFTSKFFHLTGYQKTHKKTKTKTKTPKKQKPTPKLAHIT